MAKKTIYIENPLSIKALVANGAIGANGNALLSDGTGVYWGSGAGYTGSKGEPGDFGAIGYTGSQGTTGSQGPIGYTGSSTTVNKAILTDQLWVTNAAEQISNVPWFQTGYNNVAAGENIYARGQTSIATADTGPNCIVYGLGG